MFKDDRSKSKKVTNIFLPVPMNKKKNTKCTTTIIIIRFYNNLPAKEIFNVFANRTQLDPFLVNRRNK